MLRIIAIMLAAALSGCATGAADQTLNFDSNSSKAIVVFGWEGLDGWRGMSVGISFRGVDTSYRLDKRVFFASNGNGWEAMKPTEYFVMEIEPGGYIANSTATHVGYGNNFYNFCGGTVKFETQAGKAIYIGNFTAPKGIGAVTVSPSDFEAAKAKMLEYPGVKQVLTESAMQKAPYPNSECRQEY